MTTVATATTTTTTTLVTPAMTTLPDLRTHLVLRFGGEIFDGGSPPATLFALRPALDLFDDAFSEFKRAVDIAHDDFFAAILDTCSVTRSGILRARRCNVRFSVSPRSSSSGLDGGVAASAAAAAALPSYIEGIDDEPRGFNFHITPSLWPWAAPPYTSNVTRHYWPGIMCNTTADLYCSHALRSTVARLLCTPVVLNVDDMTRTHVEQGLRTYNDVFAFLYSARFQSSDIDGGGGAAATSSSSTIEPAIYYLTTGCRKRRSSLIDAAAVDDMAAVRLFVGLFSWFDSVLEREFADSRIHICSACNLPVPAREMAMRYIRRTEARVNTDDRRGALPPLRNAECVQMHERAPHQRSAPIFYRSGVCANCYTDAFLHQVAVARHCSVDSQPSLALFPNPHLECRREETAAAASAAVTMDEAPRQQQQQQQRKRRATASPPLEEWGDNNHHHDENP